mmetsp:Transcript_21/g.46  ORF Transcript_21/g.46 Transcript_21/m.46 type:complete len:388 (-) Transcript_21:144-1307(-)|eukprot:jgi/Tetstr1/432269/TSEL_002303.t1
MAMSAAATSDAPAAAIPAASGSGEGFAGADNRDSALVDGNGAEAANPSPPYGRHARDASVPESARTQAHGEASSQRESVGIAVKRPRLDAGVVWAKPRKLAPFTSAPQGVPIPPASSNSKQALLALPKDVLVSNLFARLDGASLGRLACACRALNPLAEDAARTACGQTLGALERPQHLWSNSGLSWKQRLDLEDSFAGFDLDRGERGLFQLGAVAEAEKGPTISLLGMGPKLLVSNVSTAEQRTLRWCVMVEGNTTIEFGVVPLGQQDTDTSLHKANKEELSDGSRAVGFASEYTYGSELSHRAPIFRGSVVDIVARQGRVDYRIWHPDDAKMLCQGDGCSFMAPYMGPKLMEVSQTFPGHYPVKLACTLWARCRMRVLQPLPECK